MMMIAMYYVFALFTHQVKVQCVFFFFCKSVSMLAIVTLCQELGVGTS